MPVVPRYNSPQVQEKGLPNVKVSTDVDKDAFGGGKEQAQVTQAAQGLMGQAQKFAEEEKSKADDLATQEAYAKAVQAKNRLMYDPKEGAMNRKGKDAFGVSEEYGTKYDKELDSIEETLNNPNQKAFFQKIRLRQRTDLTGDLERHTFGESKKYEEQIVESGIKTAQENAVLNYHKPGAVAENLATQEAFVHSHASKNGLPAEWVKEKLSEVHSRTHTGVVERMLANGQDLAASQYFKNNKDKFGGKTADVEKWLEEGSLRGFSQRMSDQIMSENLSQSDALKRAKDIEDPKKRDATVERIMREYSMRDKAEREDREQMHLKAGNIIDGFGSVDAIPPAEWSKFSVSEKASLKSYAEHKRNGTEPEANGEDYYSLRLMASNPDRKGDFLRTNLREYVGKMPKSEVSKLIELQADMRAGGNKHEKVLDDWRTEDSIVKEALSAAGIDPSPKDGTSDARSVTQFRGQVAAEIRKYQADTGKKALNEDYERIANGLIVRGITEKGWIFDTRKRKFELEPSERFVEVEAKEIPSTEKRKIADALKRRGLPVTDQAITDLFNKKVKAGR